MTQQEEQLLNGLIQRVNGTELQTKDFQAEQLLQTSFGRNPDALYILCQTVLVQQFAMEKSQADLEAARDEIARLQEAGSGEKHGSFLGNLLGLTKDEPPAPQAAQQQPSYSVPTGYQPVNSAPQAPPQYGYPPQQPGYPAYPPQGGYYQQGPPMGGGMFGGGGGFLQGAMQTAAGVVAGEMAFRALEDVFSSHGGRGFEGGSGNNFLDDAGSRDGGGFGDRLAQADGYDGGVSSDIEDRRGESSGFFDGGGDSGSSSFDDSSSMDDGGSSGGDDY